MSQLNEIAPHLNNCGTCGLICCSIEVFTKGWGNSKHDSAKSSCSKFPKKFTGKDYNVSQNNARFLYINLT